MENLALILLGILISGILYALTRKSANNTSFDNKSKIQYLIVFQWDIDEDPVPVVMWLSSALEAKEWASRQVEEKLFLSVICIIPYAEIP